MTSSLAGLRRVTPWDSDMVAAFDQGRVEILVGKRPPLPGIAGSVSPIRVHDSRSFVMSANAHNFAAASISLLKIDCPSLAEDITVLARASSVSSEWRKTHCESRWRTRRLARSSSATSCGCMW